MNNNICPVIQTPSRKCSIAYEAAHLQNILERKFIGYPLPTKILTESFILTSTHFCVFPNKGLNLCTKFAIQEIGHCLYKSSYQWFNMKHFFLYYEIFKLFASEIFRFSGN